MFVAASPDMSLPLKKTQALSNIASLFYDFLPGSGNSAWKGHVSFATVAANVGLNLFWQGGSKLPAINGLLQKTFEYKPAQFEKLILEVVRNGIVYRHKKQNAVRKDEILKLNDLLLVLGFKFPDLQDQEFLNSLAPSASESVAPPTAVPNAAQAAAADRASRIQALYQIREEFFALHGEASHQKAGLQFEKVLNRLFEIGQLSPRKPFVVVGEQIDGSFDLDNETYLVEAKWQREPLPEADLLVFRGKIEGKSAFTRGVLISLNGISDPAREAITRGKQPTFFAVNGHDLTMVLSGEIALDDFLRTRMRLLAEEGLVVVPFGEISKGNRRISK